MVKIPSAGKPKGKLKKGEDYVDAQEKYMKKQAKKNMKSMKTAGIAEALKKSEKEMGYSKKPRVKGQKKKAKLTKGQKDLDY